MSLFRSGEIRMNRIVSFSVVVAIFGLLCVGTVFGQSGTGELTGLVTDSTGAVVNAKTEWSGGTLADKRARAALRCCRSSA